MRTKRYTPPPDAVYRAGQKKARATNAIKLLKEIRIDINESIFDKSNLIGIAHAINEILPVLEAYRKRLDE